MVLSAAPSSGARPSDWKLAAVSTSALLALVAIGELLHSQEENRTFTALRSFTAMGVMSSSSPVEMTME